jgi:hypothetical protein
MPKACASCRNQPRTPDVVPFPATVRERFLGKILSLEWGMMLSCLVAIAQEV